MEDVNPTHKKCIGCSDKSFLLSGFEYDDDNAGIQASMTMAEHTEGWDGIPHGGIAMGAVMELVCGLPSFPARDDQVYPLAVDFRWGGQKIVLNDTVSLSVSTVPGGAEGAVYREQDRDPYLRADVGYASTREELVSSLKSWLPGHVGELDLQGITLPRYKDCFVCGYDRKYPGLKRGFTFISRGTDKIVFSKIGFDDEDMDSFYWFRCNEKLHPLASLALIDETMGWAGFFITGQGGVTVKLSAVILRGIRLGEKIIAFGRAEKRSGRNPRLMFFWSSGGLACVNEDGTLEIIAASTAQYLSVPELTEQMKLLLKPRESMEQAFSLVEVK